MNLFGMERRDKVVVPLFVLWAFCVKLRNSHDLVVTRREYNRVFARAQCDRLDGLDVYILIDQTQLGLFVVFCIMFGDRVEIISYINSDERFFQIDIAFYEYSEPSTFTSYNEAAFCTTVVALTASLSSTCTFAWSGSLAPCSRAVSCAHSAQAAESCDCHNWEGVFARVTNCDTLVFTILIK